MSSTENDLKAAIVQQAEEVGDLHQLIGYGWTHVDPRGLITTGGPAAVYTTTGYKTVNAMWRLIRQDAELQQMQAEFYQKISEKLINLGLVVQGG